MKPQTKTILMTALVSLLAACSTIPAVESPSQPSTSSTTDNSETPRQEPAPETAIDSPEPVPEIDEPEVIATEEASTRCITWNDYQADNPKMPAGFETGCVFRAGLSMAPAINILRNDMALNDITTSGVTVPETTDGEIPWFQGNEVSNLSEAVENGDVLSYYEACTTTGRQLSYCDGFAQDEAYIINDNTACFEGQCLEVPNTHAVYLLSLWDWSETIHDLPTTVSAEQTVIRNRYRTIPLNQLSPDVPLVDRSPTDIALKAFGRTTLEEGEQPTVVSDEGYNQEDRTRTVYLTNEGLADDSIGGYRYRFDFVSFDGDNSKLIWVGQQQYCWRSYEWTRETCP